MSSRAQRGRARDGFIWKSDSGGAGELRRDKSELFFPGKGILDKQENSEWKSQGWIFLGKGILENQDCSEGKSQGWISLEKGSWKTQKSSERKSFPSCAAVSFLSDPKLYFFHSKIWLKRNKTT